MHTEMFFFETPYYAPPRLEVTFTDLFPDSSDAQSPDQAICKPGAICADEEEQETLEAQHRQKVRGESPHFDVNRP